MGREVEKGPKNCWGTSTASRHSPFIGELTIFTQRQFQRLVEMLILLHLDPSDKASMRAYRLQVKERLYRFNFVSNGHFIEPLNNNPLLQEILAQLEEEEKYEKLEETFQSVKEDYHRILAFST
jgi:histone acetyltransferase 1